MVADVLEAPAHGVGMTNARVHAGVPTGGQFAASPKTESAVTLTDPSRTEQDHQPLASMITEMKRWYSEQTDELARLDRGTTGDDPGVDDYYDAKENFEKAAAEELGRLLTELQKCSVGERSNGQIAYSGDETRIAADFGEVIICPRAAAPGTVIMIDSSGATSANPLVVMINDEVIDVPTEDAGTEATCPDCLHHVDGCQCLDRDVDDETPAHIIDQKLTEAHAASDGRAVQVLARYGMTRCIKDNFPYATYAKMYRSGDELELVGLADRFGRDIDDHDDKVGLVGDYATDLDPNQPSVEVFLTPAERSAGYDYLVALDAVNGGR